MKKLVLALAMVFSFTFAATAAELTGYITDTKCATAKGAKAADDSHADCAQACMKKGESAVLLTSEGKIYKITEQAKVTEHAGHKVTITGAVEDGTITSISDVKM